MELNLLAFVPPALPADHPCAACPIRGRTFCRNLDEHELKRFRCTGSTSRLEAGEALFHQGDRADQVCNVTAGAIKLSQLLPDGRRQVIGFLFPGDFLSSGGGDEFPFGAEALQPSEVCRFPVARFDAFVSDHPAMEQVLLRLTARDLAIAREQMVLLGRKTAEERLASFLIALEERTSGPESIRDLVRIPMSRMDIGDFLGLTKETVSRLFTAFKTGGYIRQLTPGLVRIADRRRLEALADGLH